MATIGGTRALYSAQRQFKTALNSHLKTVSQSAAGVLLRNSDTEGKIDSETLPAIKRQIGTQIEAVFVPPNQSDGLGPGGRPLAVYGDLLTRWISFAVASVVDAHAVMMRRELPEDIQRWLLMYTDTANVRVGEATNPLAEYQAPHEWVDPSGYTLSDRIWKAGIQTRLRIDALLSDGIRNGTSARDLAAQLEQFLLPTRAALRTKRPYGTDASLDAMRLARSEIARAHGQASKIAGIFNPFVTGMDWALSAAHPRVDICDGLATIGMSGDRLKEPYPPDSAPVPVESSHPNCLCHLRPYVTAQRAEVVADLRRQMEQGQPPPLTPLSVRPMLTRLLGTYLAGEALRQIAA